MNLVDATELLNLLNRKKRLNLSGICGSAISLIAVRIAEIQPAVIFLTDETKIKKRLDEISSLAPALNTGMVDKDHLRLAGHPGLVVTSRRFLHEKVGEESSKKFKVGHIISPEELAEKLQGANYTNEEIVEDEAEFSRRGGIIDVFVDGEARPVRFEFLGDEIVSIRTFDLQTQRSVETVDEAVIKFCTPGSVSLLEKISPDSVVIVDDGSPDGVDPYRNLVVVDRNGDMDLELSPPRLYFGNIAELKTDIMKSGYRYHMIISSAALLERIYTTLPSQVTVTRGFLSEGFVDKKNQSVVLTEYEIFGRIRARAKRTRFRGLFIDDLLGLKRGDYVVHEDYGIGQFEGLEILKCNGNQQECLVIMYAGNDRIFIPVENLNLVERYVGSEDLVAQAFQIGSRTVVSNPGESQGGDRIPCRGTA